MITYTKKNVNFLAFVITALIFSFIQIISSILLIENQKTFSSNYIYSRKISKYFNNNESKALNTIFNLKCSKSQNVKVLIGNNNSKSSIREIKVYKQKEDYLIKQNLKEVKKQLEKEENNEKTDLQDTSLKSKEQTIKTQRQHIQENKNIKWRIQIPKLNLDVHIEEGTTSEVLLKSVGHFEETSKWQGNVGLAAHNRGYQCNFFQNIKNLKRGDEIIYITTNGKKVYRVQTNKIIQETDWSYLQETEDNRITLITCEENRKEYRRCVQAVEVSNHVI